MIYQANKKAKLFDYNTSYMVLRTNPLLTGNVKISVDRSGDISLNSINANPTLSDSRFKKYPISGKNDYAYDLYSFFDEGSLKPEIVYEVSNKTQGSRKTSENFDSQYDFFYGAGASTLIDKNYSEDFSYFAPLYLKSELPEYFVVFKIPGPLSYPYTKNVPSGQIEFQKTYKVIQDPDSSDPFVISYGQNSVGEVSTYGDGDFFSGFYLYGPDYEIVSGKGRVVLFDELKDLTNVNSLEAYFKDKILPYSSAIATFDLRKGTKIGDYIRKITENPSFPRSPIDFNFGENSYTYFHGIDYTRGVFTKSGELLSDYLSSTESTRMIPFERFVTEGFSRKSVISSSLLNLEFLFNDPDADNYSINRYVGLYVSRNDLSSFRLNGKFYFDFRESEGNNNKPNPKRDETGYYYSNRNFRVTSKSGIRLYYENGDGFLPGSYDTNVLDPLKLYYIVDRDNNFYSLKRQENYPIGATASSYYGPYDTQSSTFGTGGSTGATSGSFVIHNKSIDLRSFTGVDDFLGSYKANPIRSKGNSYIDVEFKKPYDLEKDLVFKLTWPGGSRFEQGIRYDLFRASDYSGIFPWGPSDFYNLGEVSAFNAKSGTTKEIAKGFCDLINEVCGLKIDSAPSYSTSILRVKIPGNPGNEDYSISVFYDYEYFRSKFKGFFNPDETYESGDITLSQNREYLSYDGISWEPYLTFGSDREGFGNIASVDFSRINSDVIFRGGSDYSTGRFSFLKEDSEIIKVDSWVQSSLGFSRVVSITRYVDSPSIDPLSEKVNGFKNFDSLLVANLETPERSVPLINDQSQVSVYSTSPLYSGVFTFFDVKDFDYDFWESNYSSTPMGEVYRYFSIQPSKENSIKDQEVYYVKKGQILYNGSTYSAGNIFLGDSTSSSFSDLEVNNQSAIVIPARYTQLVYFGFGENYGETVKYEQNLDLFTGFYGLESLENVSGLDEENKVQVFESSKLSTEYEYLQENYNTQTANVSRIVPFINKWSLSSSTDSRGNPYRLNVSPVFSPTNFSPSLEKAGQSPQYFTHEWYLLESPPHDYPVDLINDQSSYLPSPPDYSKLFDSDPSVSNYFNQKFTVSPLDYLDPYKNEIGETKEYFSEIYFNESSGFYESIFRGVKYVIRRRSNVADLSLDDPRSYIPNYRGFEGYKFTCVLRLVEEDLETVQSPVEYEFVENNTQKFIMLLIKVVIKDYRILSPGSSTGLLDYTLLYSLSDKKELVSLDVGGSFYGISDSKLSSSLDLSFASKSYSNSYQTPGRVYIYPNKNYDTDLREEIKITFSEGGSSSYDSLGSFRVNSTSSIYPWPIGIAKDFIEFGSVTDTYYFNLPFTGISGPDTTIPIGAPSFYRNLPVFQKGGGIDNLEFVMNRIGMSYIKERINSYDPYVKYKSYSWQDSTKTTTLKENQFNVKIESPTNLYKSSGLYPVQSFQGPSTVGENQPTSYNQLEDSSLASDILRFSGFYEPMAKKVIRFSRDKDDTIQSDNRIDLSFRNCNFGVNKLGFGLIKNLNFTKVSLGQNILSASDNLPEGAVYPLVNQTPISKKDFSIFLSSWDPGYYDLFTSEVNRTPVAGTRSMLEKKTFFGSKMMKTPPTVRINTFISMEVSKNEGEADVEVLNSLSSSYLKPIQEIERGKSGNGVGQLPNAFTGSDIEKIDEGVYPDVEFFWQRLLNPFATDQTNGVKGIIRVDRMLRRYFLNDGVSKVFFDNMISEFGVGSPTSLNDDIIAYIDQNINPIYRTLKITPYIKSAGESFELDSFLIRGDILPPDRSRENFQVQENFSLTKRSDLIYEFNFPLNPSKYYSITFSIDIIKI